MDWGKIKELSGIFERKSKSLTTLTIDMGFQLLYYIVKRTKKMTN